MPRRGISQVPKAPKSCRAAHSRFETKAKSAAIDRNRSQMLSAQDAKRPRELAKRLSALSLPATPASSRYMRKIRKRFTGWAVFLTGQAERYSVFTVLAPGWRIRSKRLLEVNARALTARLRADLYRSGAKGSSGWLSAFIDGDYDPRNKTFQLHIHLICTDGMIGVVNAMRDLPKYKSGLARLHPGDNVRVRIKEQSGPFLDPFAVLSYQAKSFWLTRESKEWSEGLSPSRDHRRRISDKHHCRMLLWFDRHRVEDLSLIIGLKITKTEVIATRPAERG